ncbi:hypothetical protein Cst_c03140 [Thermoclostridium stercorarium subsp. stercorarium DSM 8532]|uniref:CRISPR-associated protein Cas6 C-terminal domain-containing protein n=5 Tax=Thermoclostridium stercorarium TaxID=1510 RepID=L7VP63_THES1|nr:hypothetical protein [Thermoclostridium stercorarium]AGC67338.1 hypothetical protein Cst_c03140 [Thermoclostridium stercorarium subsp. stercorarium DSM 8532]AGI38399.1 hypothetical protein Clst_0296 [Thermoclostridium stercorarium subsp. stercorarium DSM 8532]ANW97834.1 hypothetical protein CSTERTH_01675 [Thermoclostridium stercorarium subsp. thermolacticum DSM 2910]ANX00386.1 hypothetical protein CSTERLE_01655 [Thermoclostridium stercorarium subsp. leptospartum DSM 9219]UZQ85929.1 hypothet
MRNISFLHLKFTVRILQDCRMPKQKVSTLTGAMLNKFKRLYCIHCGSDISCNNCDCKDICLVLEMTGKGFDKNIPIAKQPVVSPKFIILCSDGRTEFKENDMLEFEIMLFDNLTHLFVQYIYVFDTIGQSGIGSGKIKYKLLYVSDEKGNIVFSNSALVGNPAVADIFMYISSRMNDIDSNNGNTVKMSLVSPVMLNAVPKGDENRIVIFNTRSLSCSIKERLNIFNMLEKEDEEKLNQLAEDKQAIGSVNIKITKSRYYIQSERKFITIPVLTGYVVFDARKISPCLEYFFACEKIGIGQNMLLGFGRYFMG